MIVQVIPLLCVKKVRNVELVVQDYTATMY